MLLFLSREPYDKGRPQMKARDRRTQCLNQIFDMLPLGLAPHQLEHFLVDMLQWHINVLHHFGTGGDRFH